MKFKLPDDPKERQQTLVLIGIGVAAVIYVLFTYVHKPMQAKKAECIKQIKTQENDIKQAKQVIKRIPRDQDDALQALDSVMQDSRRHLIHPRLGENYLLEATDYLETLAGELGMTLNGISDRGMTDAPKSDKRLKKNAFRVYTANVQLHGGMADIIRFLAALEERNPYLTVDTIQIVPSAQTPATHLVSINIMWPTWVDLAVELKVESKRAALEERILARQGRRAAAPATLPVPGSNDTASVEGTGK